MKNNFTEVVHVDEKILAPSDSIGSSTTAGHSSGDLLRPGGLNKSLIGKPKIYDLNGNLLAEEDNLVVLRGREFLAQLIAERAPVGAPGTSCPNNTPVSGSATACNYTNYRLTHFAVGDAGTNGDCPPVAQGPYDDDINLYNPKNLKDTGSVGSPDYLDLDGPAGIVQNGLKRIEFDGSVELVSEEHTINTSAGGQIQVNTYTAIKFKMYLVPGEATLDPAGGATNIPFDFNEAGLFAVEYDTNGDPVLDGTTGAAKAILFARFTTLDKYLEDSDGIMIEWYVLV